MRATALDIMSPDFPRVRTDQTVLEATTFLHALRVDSMPIVDGQGNYHGIFGSRDLPRLIAGGQDLRSVCLEELAKGGPALRPSDSLDDALTMMRERGVMAAPVAEDGLLVGVITHLDIEAYNTAQAMLGDGQNSLIWDVSPHDPAYGGIRGQYLLAGLSALQCIQRALDQAPNRILDLGCGHGRVLRVLKAAFPQAGLAACDLDRDCVDFCAQTFGATPWYSNADPDAVRIDDAFDLVWSGSLFTHLSAEKWPRFLSLIDRCTKPGAKVVFTTQSLRDAAILRTIGLTDPEIATLIGDYDQSGFGYVEMESGSYGPGQPWGISMSSPDWVRATVGEHPGLEVRDVALRAWRAPFPLQDVVTCVRTGP